MPKPRTVPPRAYPVDDCGLPFSRGTLYRWEGLGLIKLLRVGGKTLISAEMVDAILSGEVALPRAKHVMHPPKPPRPRQARHPKREQSISAAE
jgi:hypothetical protein